MQFILCSLFSEDFHRKKVLNIADLGCATGPNTFSVILTVKESLERKCKELNCQPPELQVYLNDLLGNDFNSLFKDLPRSVKIKRVMFFFHVCEGSS
ncbi:unnamed protein product [Ilex paraguariensis]|uniref:Uncharacterized protein n=1 Tax=Ilex paraguariensis TaxID=185542 RepID=A0ABC8UTK5_9AQUA